jgi:hypothetical protein
MAELKPIMGRLISLDRDGNPVGESTQFEAATLRTAPMRLLEEGYLECAIAASAAMFNLSVQMEISAKAFKVLLPMLFGSREEFRRHRFYHKHGYGHAPRRRNKHGRTGVKR